MISKKFMVPLSIVVLFCFSTTCIAGNLHFGIVSAIESKIGDLEKKQWEKKTTYEQVTTGANGTIVVSDSKHNLEATVSTVDATTGTPIEGIQVDYINTGKAIICIAKDDPDYFPSFAIQPFPQSSRSLEYQGDIVQPQMVITVALILTLVSVGLTLWSAYDLLFEDPPYVNVVREDPAWVEKRTCGDVEDILDLLGLIPFVNAGAAVWVKFAIPIGKKIGLTAAEKGLKAIGIDPDEDHCYTTYELKSDPTVKAPFMFAENIQPNQRPKILTNPSPANGVTSQSVNVDLRWTGGDPDPGDTVIYDVYLEANNSDPDVLVSNDQSSTNFDPGTLTYNTSYYWKIVATDNWGSWRIGEVWNFTTEPALPWKYRKKITIDHTKIDEDLTDFPVLVKLTSFNFDFLKARTDGYDIRFTDAAGNTFLKYERERHDSGNDKAEYWVKIPSISKDTDTEFYIYYCATDAPDGEDPTAVWDSNFKGVWHLKGLGDSTTNNNTLTNHGTTEVDGKIAKAKDFERDSSQYLSHADAPALSPTGDITIEFWVKHETLASNYYMTKWDETTNFDYTLYMTGGDKLRSQFVSDGDLSPGHETDTQTDTHQDTAWTGSDVGVWRHVALTIDVSGPTVAFYKDGVADTTTYLHINATSIHDGVTDFRIGSVYSSYHRKGAYADGVLDEIRLSHTARSAAWTKASYNSGNDSLLTYGSEELNQSGE